MDFKFEVTAPAPQPALAIRTRTPVTAIGEVMGQAFGKVYQYMLEIGAKPGECAFAAYYNMDMNDLDVDIGFVLAEPAPGRGEIHAMDIPGGQQVSCIGSNIFIRVLLLGQQFVAAGRSGQRQFSIAEMGFEPAVQRLQRVSERLLHSGGQR